MLPTRVATAIKRGGDVDLNGLRYDRKREVSEINKNEWKRKKKTRAVFDPLGQPQAVLSHPRPVADP